MDFNITFTAAACDYIKKMIVQDNGIGFRLSIKKTGCSGYSYVPTIINNVNPNDITFTIAEGVTIYIDASCQEMLHGLKIDYIEEEKSGLKQKRLIFINPNETSRCGCGESFHIDEVGRV